MFILETFSEIHSLQKTYFKETIKTAPLISFRMERIFLKIPDLAEKIFKELDNQSLVKCKEVQRSWYNFINEEKVLWFRIIQNYIRNDNKFLHAWRKVLTKVPVDFVTQVALATQRFDAEPQIHSLLSPIHVAANDSDVDFYKQMLVKVDDMNPNNILFGNIDPLFVAAGYGQF